MPKSLNMFIDYIPAQLKKGTKGDWRIVYSVKDPITNELIRKKPRVTKIKNSREREKYALRIISEINRKLENGWNPSLEQSNIQNFALLINAIDLFLKFREIDMKRNNLRPDTFRTYKTHLKVLKEWLGITKNENLFTIKFDEYLIQDFFTYIYYERKVEPRTYNNYLGSIRVFSNFLLKKKYITNDPCVNISKMKNRPKKREIILPEDIKRIKSYFTKHNPNYNVLMGITLYCLIRRTELTKLKVKDILLNEKLIVIKDHQSKNKKIGEVTIPKNYIFQLSKHIKNANMNDYIFSANNFKPGQTKLSPKKVSDTWAKMRKELNLPKEYQFYSLKDTGITHYINSGLPANKVKEQARHHDIRITEKYIQRNKKADEDLFNTDLSF